MRRRWLKIIIGGGAMLLSQWRMPFRYRRNTGGGNEAALIVRIKEI